MSGRRWCECGSELVQVAEVKYPGLPGGRPVFGPGLDPCVCPRCISCARRLSQADIHPTCQNLNCWAYGVWQLRPVYGVVSTQEYAMSSEWIY